MFRLKKTHQALEEDDFLPSGDSRPSRRSRSKSRSAKSRAGGGRSKSRKRTMSLSRLMPRRPGPPPPTIYLQQHSSIRGAADIANDRMESRMVTGGQDRNTRVGRSRIGEPSMAAERSSRDKSLLSSSRPRKPVAAEHQESKANGRFATSRRDGELVGSEELRTRPSKNTHSSSTSARSLSSDSHRGPTNDRLYHHLQERIAKHQSRSQRSLAARPTSPTKPNTSNAPGQHHANKRPATTTTTTARRIREQGRSRSLTDAMADAVDHYSRMNSSASKLEDSSSSLSYTAASTDGNSHKSASKGPSSVKSNRSGKSGRSRHSTASSTAGRVGNTSGGVLTVGSGRNPDPLHSSRRVTQDRSAEAADINRSAASALAIRSSNSSSSRSPHRPTSNDANRSAPSALAIRSSSSRIRPQPTANDANPLDSSRMESPSIEDLLKAKQAGLRGRIEPLKDHSGPSGNTKHHPLSRPRSRSMSRVNSSDDDPNELLSRSSRSLGRSRRRSVGRRERMEQRKGQREERRVQRRSSQRSLSVKAGKDKREELEQQQERSKSDRNLAIQKACEKFNGSGILSYSSGGDNSNESRYEHGEEEVKREIESHHDDCNEFENSDSALITANSVDLPGKQIVESKQLNDTKPVRAKEYLSGEKSTDDEREWKPANVVRRGRDDFRSNVIPTTRSRSVDLDVPLRRRSDKSKNSMASDKTPRMRSRSVDKFPEEAEKALKVGFLDSHKVSLFDRDTSVSEEVHSREKTNFQEGADASMSQLQDRLLKLAAGQQVIVRSRSTDASSSSVGRSSIVEQEGKSRETASEVIDGNRSKAREAQKLYENGFFILAPASKSGTRFALTSTKNAAATMDDKSEFSERGGGNMNQSSACNTEGALDGSVHVDGERALEKKKEESRHRVVLEDPHGLLPVGPRESAELDKFRAVAGYSWARRNYDGGRAA
eukprot:CAMPEP_0178658432 /NCGR_PEP_ID=MMETSP0698-20121128/25977_1 /TAXON_ID=265572 /ORGANISM="Extubocellulus spinifer, Strain CCMP396" /LENGTH=944 /DNA_ID=CAMNT_0020300799 /DNA_START=287 /DNA_END=3121 /DNA_ORIENTATION=+